MEEKVIKAYKGFNADLTCRDFQYEVGKEYEIKGDIECCENGFHACQSPLDVFGYYLLDKDCNLARFCEVEQSGKIDTEQDGDTKAASSKIKIKAEIKFADFIKLGVEWIKEKVADKSTGEKLISDNGGDYAQIGSSGYYAKIGSSGYSAKIGSSGDSAKIGSSGYYAQIGSSGYSAQIGSSGDYAQIGSSGDYAKIGSSGDYAQIGSSGDYAQIGSSGDYAVVAAIGINSMAKAKKGSWITLAEYKRSNKGYIPVCVKTEQVDGKRIKEDTYYKLINGIFTEVKD